MSSRPLVLVCVVDTDFYYMLDHILEVEGFETLPANDPDEIQELAQKRRPDAILLDCRPRSLPAAEICNRLKSRPETRDIGIIALISQGAKRDYIDIAKAGVDETLVRPILPVQLVERLRAMLEPGAGEKDRLPSKPEQSISELTQVAYAGVDLNLDTHRVRRNGTIIHLGPIEFKLLHRLLQKPEQVLSRDELISAAWEPKVYVGPRTVDVHVGRLRKALNSVAGKELIRTVRSFGYALSKEGEIHGRPGK